MSPTEPFTKPDLQPQNTRDPALQQRLLVMSTLMMAVAAIFWGGIYFFFNEPLAAFIPWSYSIVSFISLVFFRTDNLSWILRESQLLLSLLLPFLVMWELGGFVNSSAVVIWSLTCPMGAVVFVGRKAAIAWFVAFVALILIGAAIGYPSTSSTSALPPALIVTLFVMNLSGVSIVAFVLLSYFVKQKDGALGLLAQERERSESLIRNMLPASISERLKRQQKPIADRLEGVTILFADIVGFTSYAMQRSPEEIVTLLDNIFSKMDEIAKQYGLEKIKTIGDAYMVCGGLAGNPKGGALATAHFAVDVMTYLKDLSDQSGLPLDLRIGLNTGPVVAGVIGQSKFSYDIWGDAVNVAARLQQNADPGSILISKETGDLILSNFDLRPLGDLKLKGHSPVATFELRGSLTT